MSSQTFSLKSLQTLRRFLKQRLVLPECEHAPNTFMADEMPEPDSLAGLSSLFDQGGLTHVADSAPNTNGRWFISTVDASNVIKQLPGLTFHPNYCLVTYLYRVQKANISHGRAATWAIAKRPHHSACSRWRTAKLHDRRCRRSDRWLVSKGLHPAERTTGVWPQRPV